MTRPVNPWLIAPVVALAAFMEIMDISIANVSLPHIAGDLSSSQDESAWVLTSYLVTNAVVMPISGWLSNRFGRKRFFMLCVVGFTLASLLCGLAPSLGALIFLRAAQGAAGGGLQPSGQAILADSFPPEKRGMASAVYGIAAVFAPAIGPTLGGWITDNYTWRWIFFINVPVGIALFFLIGALIQDSQSPARARSGPVDWWGFGFVALSLGCLQVVLDRGQQDDWFGSHFILVLTIVSAIAFVLLIVWEWNHPNPMVNLRLLGNADFATAFVLMGLLGFMLLGSTFLVPAYVQSLMGYRAIDAGMVLTPGGFVIIALMPIMGRVINLVDIRLLLGAGLIICGSSLLWMTNFYLDASFNTIMMARMAQAAGLAFLFVPINTIAFRSIRPEQTNNASALVNLARNFGGSIGISFASILLIRREQFHQSRLTENLQAMNPAYPDYANHVASAYGTTAHSPQAMAHIYERAIQQATLLSYLDAFEVLGLIFLAAILVLFFLKPGVGGAAGVGVH